jgi:hypothetical protein
VPGISLKTGTSVKDWWPQVLFKHDQEEIWVAFS